jgi:predicted TPR repeat methyltransferase
MTRNSSRSANPYRAKALPGDLRSLEILGLLRKAELSFDANDFATAVRWCQEVLRRDADQPRALQLLGTMAQRTGANDVAIGFFKRALTIDKALVSARLGLGDAYMASKQWDAAATSYRKAIALEPKNADAHSSLGAALLASGDRPKAISSFRRATALDPHHRLSAYMISELTGGVGPEQADYVRGVFDDYAPIFEEHLVGTLRYQTPQIIADALAVYHPEKFIAALDLGCGTGLVAASLDDRRVGIIDGIDLSPKMIEVARQKGRYRELYVGDLLEFLARPIAKSFGYDLVIAADVFIYVGRLEEIFSRVSEVLRPNGFFAFSVEHSEMAGYTLQASSRHAHGEQYVADLALSNGFERLPSREVALRQENKIDILGRVEVLRLSSPNAPGGR